MKCAVTVDAFINHEGSTHGGTSSTLEKKKKCYLALQLLLTAVYQTFKCKRRIKNAFNFLAAAAVGAAL